MTVACVYNKKREMRVVSFDDRNRLLSTGEWFNNPNCYNDGVEKNDGQIRRRQRQRKRECSIETT